MENQVHVFFACDDNFVKFTYVTLTSIMENASKDLCIRWYTLGTFYPFMRNHNFFAAKDQYPWTFGDDALKIINTNKHFGHLPHHSLPPFLLPTLQLLKIL